VQRSIWADNISQMQNTNIVSPLQRILQELKDVIESMRWASSEESKTKIREIDNLKDQLHKANVSREESLELQRRYCS
jgi:hypothetical protein